MRACAGAPRIKRLLIAALLACVSPLSHALAQYTLICTPSSGAPTDVRVPGAANFDDACRAIASRGYVRCVDGQGQRGICPAGPGRTLSLDEIADKAAASHCASYEWQGRGRAPRGYIRGIAMSYARYARAVCQARGNLQGALTRIAGPLGDPSTDTLAWYAANGAAMSVPLRDVYTLAIGEGMRESSGNPTEGADTTANNPPEGAEAGLFQSSFDSFNADPALRELWDFYRANPTACRFDTFMQGSTDRGQAVVGTGGAAEFQTFTKQCPAFALDYALVLLRVLRQHFGPINRLEAEFRAECAAMLVEIENTVSCSE